MKHFFLAALMLGMGSAVLGQTQLKTYDVSDTNLSGEVTVADVTTVANQVVTAAQGQQMVTAEQLNQVLQMIDSRLAALETAQGISHPDQPEVPAVTASFAAAKKIMHVGETFTQAVTTTSDGQVSYLSSDTNVATVDAATGLVTAKANGEATIVVTITATSKYPAASAAYTIVVEAMNQHNGHEYVDLGVVVHGKKILWAKTNIGAEKPADYGDYYAWGETETKSSYNIESYEYKTFEGSPAEYDADGFLITPEKGRYHYSNIFDDISGTKHDVAHVKWGGEWRMPSHAEQEALLNQCDCKWTSMNVDGKVVNGLKVTNKNDSSKYIFLPAAGNRGGSSLWDAGWVGYYWSSSLPMGMGCGYAGSLLFDSSYQGTSDYDLCLGQSVRAVCVLSE